MRHGRGSTGSPPSVGLIRRRSIETWTPCCLPLTSAASRFFDVLLRHYGYPTFDFGECPMDGNDVAFLFKFPFKFEKDYVEKGKWEKVTREQLRQMPFQKMATIWQMGKQGRLVFPKVIRPKTDGA